MVVTTPQVQDGARAAAGDSAGENALVSDEEKRRRKRLATDLAGVFNMLDRCITLLRVYPVGHPLVDGFCDQIAERIQGLLDADRHEEMRVQVRATELLTDWGEAFFTQETTERDHFLWYRPFSDGIFGLVFSSGLTGDEIQGLMTVINRVNKDLVGLDDDTVTLLWEQDFDNISYYALDGFMDTIVARDFGALTEPQARDVLINAAIDPKKARNNDTLRTMFNTAGIDTVDVFTSTQMKTKMNIEVKSFRKSDLAFAFKYDAATAERLLMQWLAANDLEHRFIEALISVIRTHPNTEAGRRAGRLIVDITNQMLDTEQYIEAVSVVTMLDERREVFANTDFDPLQEILEPLAEPMRLDALFNRLQKLEEQREAIARLLCFVAHDAVQHHALVMVADKKREFVNVEAVVDVLIRVTGVENSANLEAARFTEEPLFVERLMTCVPKIDYRAWVGTGPLLKLAAKHSSWEVRLAAIQLDHPVWQTERVAETLIAALASDDFEDVRRQAMKLLGQWHRDLFKTLISQTIDRADVRGRTPGEVRFLMRTYTEYDPEAVGRLRRLLTTRGWFNGRRRDLARAAAVVLVQRGDREAVALIDRRAKSFLTHRGLRDDYTLILKQIDPRLLPGASPETAADRAPDADEEQSR